jgi:hypothetical protein
VTKDGGEARISRFEGAAAVVAAWLIVLGFFAIVPGETRAQSLGVDESVALVRGIHFEGVPEDRARRVGAEGASRLIEMLRDPTESATHANVLVVLGLCGQPGALDAITAWAAIPRTGELDRETYRAWQALPYALGHAAEFDPRAVAHLEATLEENAPNWSFRHHRGARLRSQSRRGAASALGMTGLPEAGQALERANRVATDPQFDRHLRESLEEHERRAARGRTR